jgi:hypothetical protein
MPRPPAGNGHPRSLGRRTTSEPVNLTPITRENAVGRRVVVPILPGWEKYECVEHDGQGWEARILSATGRSAVVEFLYATTPSGRRYKPERVSLELLRPL